MAKTQTPFPALMIFICFALLLINSVKSDSVSFSFSNFGSEQDYEIGYLGDARPVGGVIQLTKRENGPFGTVIEEHSVGRAVYIPPIRIWNKYTEKLADFQTEFTFVVDPAGSAIHADGLAFFILPLDADPSVPKNSSGGYLGLFSPETAFNANKNQIVAIEFDSFGNEWDPIAQPDAPHIGIDINSLESVKTTGWPINSVSRGSVGKALVTYNSNTKKLSVAVVYGTIKLPIIATVSHTIDLRNVLTEWVRIGFSAATGDSVETHDILSWSFSSTI